MRNIKVKLDNKLLSLDKLNCLEIAIAYCLQNYGECYKKYFILYLKALQSYSVKGYQQLEVLYPITIHSFLKEILKDLNMKVINCNHRDFEKFVLESIDNNQLVFASCNLYELYYSPYYQDKSARHVILVNGYDLEKNLCLIIDNSHLYETRCLEYADFSMPMNLMEDMIRSYKKSFNTSFICKIEQIKSCFSRDKILIKIINIVCNSEDLWEEVYIRKIQEEIFFSSSNSTELTINVLQLMKNKELFYFILLEELKEFLDMEKWNSIKSKATEVTKCWRNIFNTCLVKMHKKEKFEISDKYIEVVNKEKSVKSFLASIKIEESPCSKTGIGI